MRGRHRSADTGIYPARDAVWWYFMQRSSLSTAAPRSLTTGNSVSQSHIRKIRSTARLLTISSPRLVARSGH
jgi:hypothetical protein